MSPSLQGESVLTCDANGKWSSEAPSCQPVSCGQPALTTHTRVNYILPEHNQPHSFGSTASYYCLEGYELIGNLFVFLFFQVYCLTTRGYKEVSETQWFFLSLNIVSPRFRRAIPSVRSERRVGGWLAHLRGKAL